MTKTHPGMTWQRNTFRGAVARPTDFTDQFQSGLTR